MNVKEYRKKVEGCFLGKTIGGTLGAPLEGKRNVFEVSYYLQDVSRGGIPNDDLDLQLIWLNAAEKYRTRLDASILGEYWQFYIIPNWGEYGAGKNNMRMGFPPPLSGHIHNIFGHSCGAFIRSEIWACLAPGNPDIAVRYAYEDAIVDHFGEGLYAEIFCAALESAAFVEDDLETLVDIGLSYIPKDCGIARAVSCVRDSRRENLDWKEARRRLLFEVPGSFGALCCTPEERDDTPIGEVGWDAPSNIGLVVLALLYGDKDFSKTVCMAAACGEDADCTAATAGAMLGIILEQKEIDPKWTAPIGREIKTMCVNACDQGVTIPKTVDELVERILRLAPFFLGDRCDLLAEGGYEILPSQEKELYQTPRRVNAWQQWEFSTRLAQSPFVVRYEFPLFTVYVDYEKNPFIAEGEPRELRLRIENEFYQQQWLTLTLHAPEGVSVLPSVSISLPLEQNHCNFGFLETTFSVVMEESRRDICDCILEIASLGHHSKGLIPIRLLVREKGHGEEYHGGENSIQ